MGPRARVVSASRKRPAYQRTTLIQKEIVVSMFNEGKTIAEAARFTGVNVNTTKAIIQRYTKNGGQIVESKRGGSRSVKLSPGILAKIEQIIEENHTSSLQSIANKIRESENLSISLGTVRRGLFNLRITLKKPMQQEECFTAEETVQRRKAYAMHFMQTAPQTRDTIIFIDETGFNFHTRKNNHTRVVSVHSPAARGRDVSIFAAMNTNGMVLTKTEANQAIHPRVFCAYLRELLRTLNGLNLVNAMLVLDDRALHNSPEVREMVNSSGHTLTFLPSGSQMFNPLGNVFSKIKLSARNMLGDDTNNMSFVDVIQLSTKTITPADCSSSYLNMTTQLSLAGAGQPLIQY